MKKVILYLTAIITCCSCTLRAQHKINISVAQFAGDTLILGHYFRESLLIKDTAILDARGNGVFEGKEILPGGLYAVFLPNRNRFDLLVDKNQNFSVVADTTDLIAKTVIKGDQQNAKFYDYQNYISAMRKKVIPLEMKMKSQAPDAAAAKQEFEKINIEVKANIDKVISENEGTFLGKFLMSMKEVEVPDPPRDAKGMITDSSFQYRYYKKHYFDYFDLSDVRLLRTPFYERKILTYLDKLVIPNPDSIYREVDMMIQKSRTDTFLFKYMVTTLFNHYAESNIVGMDAVYVYIAEKYYIPEAAWSPEKFRTDLAAKVRKLKPLLLMKDAPDAQLVRVPDEHFIQASKDTVIRKNPYVGDIFNLRQVKSRYLVLYFWEADCGHCQKSIPVLHTVYEKYKDKGLQVIAVNMLAGVEGKVKWVDFINKNKLYGWINAWNPYDFSYREIYDINSSNIVYLFDEQKKIISKRITPEQVEQIILDDMKKNRKAN